MKKLLGLWLLVGFILFQATAMADNHGNARSVTTMDEVVVSVTQTETALEDIGGNSVTVITAQDIEEKKYHTVEEILKTVPGVTITSNGGMGTKSSVFMRGADSKNTLVLMDGIMVNDPSGANRDANLSDINLDNVERIEVVRGAMSVMYGSNATAGVINIITRKGKADPEITTTVEGGSYGTFKAAAAAMGAMGATGRFDYSISASTFTRDGFSVADADNNRIPQAGNTDEEDGYRNRTFAGKFGFDVNENVRISSTLRYVEARVDLDDYEGGYTGDNISSSWILDPVSGNWINTLVADPDGPTRKRSESESLWGQVALNNTFADGKVDSILSYKFSRNDRQSYDNNNDPWYDYEGDTDEVSWQGNINFDGSILSFGAGYFVEAMESLSSSVTGVDTRTVSYWVQDQIFIGERMTLIAGARLDDHESFGNKATFRIAPSYEIFETNTLLKASFGTGFRSPSLYELFSFYGNPDLDPEESTGWDAGFEQGLLNDRIRFGITYFEMDFKNRIDYDFMSSRYNQLPGKTETSGVEVFAKWEPLPDLSCTLNYTYTDTKDPDGRRLVRRPYHQTGLNTTWRFLEKGLVSVDVKWVGERAASSYARDKYNNPVESLDAYTLVNMAASYDITKSFQVFARVDNLLDEYYEEAFSYATAGLSGYLGFKMRW